MGGKKAALAGDVAKIGYEIYKDELNQCVPMVLQPSKCRRPSKSFSLRLLITDQPHTWSTHRSDEHQQP